MVQPCCRIHSQRLLLLAATVAALLMTFAYRLNIPDNPKYLTRNLKDRKETKLTNNSDRNFQFSGKLNRVQFLPRSPTAEDAVNMSGSQKRHPEKQAFSQEVADSPSEALLSYGRAPIYNPVKQFRLPDDPGGETLTGDSYIPTQRLVHFDLKGAPPRISYLEKVFQIISKLGATGILLEYEDMFPYTNDLAKIAAKNHYSPADVQYLLQAAERNNLIVIPLVQTFGHLEFALKIAEMVHLREVPESPQSICPSNNGSFSFVSDMIDQILSVHQSKYIHIGCDEVYQLGECSVCKNKPRDTLFLDHVAKVGQYVRSKGRIPIIWHDMMQHMSVSQLRQSGIGTIVEPMVWVYAEEVYRFVPMVEWDKYSQVFPTVWAASAFKGAFGETLILPDVKRHLQNNLNWLAVLKAEKTRFKNGISGIALTGWQRYDHFAVLAELLPSALPSLAVTLSAVTHGEVTLRIAKQIYGVLECLTSPKYESMYDLNYDPKLLDKFSWCFFPGAPIFKSLSKLESLQFEVTKLWQSVYQDKGWMTDYNARYNMSARSRVDETTGNLNSLCSSVTMLAKTLAEALSDVYENYTVIEWLEQKILPLLEVLGRIRERGAQLKARTVWRVRPEESVVDWKKYNINLVELMEKKNKKSQDDRGSS